MAEGRMLKKNISDSRRLAELKTDSARMLWTWTIPFLDVEGRFYASPDMVKGKVVPRLKTFTEAKIEEYLQDMARVGLITMYEVDGDKYQQYRKFDDFQNIRKDREGKPLPGPEEGTELQDNSGSNPGELRPNLREVKLREDKLIKERFDVFYELYPRKEAKAKALDAWKKISVDAPLFEKIKIAVAKQIKYKAHLTSTNQFCPEWPHPATWLNQRRWEDEIPQIPKSKWESLDDAATV